MDYEGKKAKTLRHLAFLLALLVAHPAAANWDLIKGAGLEGSWRQDCGKPIAPDNRAHIYFADGSGRSRLAITNGPTAARREATIDEVMIPAALGQVSYRITYDDGSIWHNVVQITGKHHRSVQLRREGSPVAVKDGIITATGEPTPLLEKCGGANG